MFGAAPSVGLASLALASYERGAHEVATLARSMLIGAFALFFYCVACVIGTGRTRWPVWLPAALSWGVWFGVALMLLFAGEHAGVLQ
jgi:hypothetical protein